MVYVHTALIRVEILVTCNIIVRGVREGGPVPRGARNADPR